VALETVASEVATVLSNIICLDEMRTVKGKRDAAKTAYCCRMDNIRNHSKTLFENMQKHENN